MKGNDFICKKKHKIGEIDLNSGSNKLIQRLEYITGREFFL